MLKSDIAPFFPKQSELEVVYAIFDKDENGDVSLEEIEMACLDVSSLDLGFSAVRRY